jgi:hypothetical protein
MVAAAELGRDPGATTTSCGYRAGDGSATSSIDSAPLVTSDARGTATEARGGSETGRSAAPALTHAAANKAAANATQAHPAANLVLPNASFTLRVSAQ